jgi:hypothetical protein
MRFLSLALIFILSATAKADFYALCIGTNADPERTTHKKYKCVFNKDAVVMSKMLKKKGAKTVLLYGWINSDDVYREIQEISKKTTRHLSFSAHMGNLPKMIFS